MPGNTTQDCLNVAGSLLFRGGHVNKPIRVLSGGERARLCMASLLLGDYNILVLDEPTAALDHETQKMLMQALGQLKHTMSVVLITHRPELVRERLSPGRS